jgi:ubiquinone biosynthesis monooxygenase Coq7
MPLVARLAPGETLGDRVLRVDHAGEHGAVCVYRAQRWLARWTAPDLLDEINDFIAHETRHRALFAAELATRGQPHCLSYPICAALGTVLGFATGLLGRRAIAATTVAIERVVLQHMAEQIDALAMSDPAAVGILQDIIADEREHHDRSTDRLSGGLLERLLVAAVGASTEAVIWIGMRR